MKPKFLRIALALPLLAAVFSAPTEASNNAATAPQVRVLNSPERAPMTPFVSATLRGTNLLVDMDGRWLDSPTLRRVRVVAKDPAGVVIYNEIHTAERVYGVHRRSAYQQAHATVALPRRGRIAVVEVTPIRTP